MTFDKEHYNVCVFVTSHDNYVLETVQRRKRLVKYEDVRSA